MATSIRNRPCKIQKNTLCFCALLAILAGTYCLGPDISSIAEIPHPFLRPKPASNGRYLNFFADWNAREYETSDLFRHDRLWTLDTVDLAWKVKSTHGDAPIRRLGHCITAIGNIIYLFGGRSVVGLSNELFAYDVSMGEWREIDTADRRPPIREDHLCFEAKGSLFIYGGAAARNARTDIWKFDSDKESWGELYYTNDHPLYLRSRAQFYNNTIYLAGTRYDNYGAQTMEFWSMNIGTMKWMSHGKFDGAYLSPNSEFIVFEEKLIFLGSEMISSWMRDQQYIFVLHRDTMKVIFHEMLQVAFQPLQYPILIPSARTSFALSSYERSIYLVGGVTGAGTNDIWIFDIDNHFWSGSSLSKYPMVRADANVAAISDTEIGFFGGLISENNYYLINDLWIFQTDSKKWVLVHRESECATYETDCAPLVSKAAFAHYDSQLFILGMSTNDYYEEFAVARRFNLGTRTWSALDLGPDFFDCVALFDMNGHLVKENKLFLYGGRFGNMTTSTAINVLDLESSTFQSFPNPNQPPIDVTASFFWMEDSLCTGRNLSWTKYPESSSAIVKDAIHYSKADFLGQPVRFGKNFYSELLSWVYVYHDGKWNPSISADKFARPTYSMKTVRIGSRIYQIGGSDFEFLNSVYTYDLAETWCQGETIVNDESGELDDGSGRFLYFPNTKCAWTFQKTTHVILDKLAIKPGASLIIETIGGCSGKIYGSNGASNQVTLSNANKDEIFWIPSGRFRVRFGVALDALSADGFGMTYRNCPAGTLLVNKECVCPGGHFINFLGHCIRCPSGSLQEEINQYECFSGAPAPFNFFETVSIAPTELRELTEGPPPMIYGSAFEHESRIYVLGGASNLDPEDPQRFIPMDTIFVASAAVLSAWSRVRASGDIPSPRIHHSLVNAKGRVFLIGGQTSFPDPSLYELNLESLTWSRRGLLPFEMQGGLSVVYKDAIFVYGGVKENGTASNRLLKYFPDNNSWEIVKVEWTLPSVINPVGGLFGDSLYAFSGSDGVRETNYLLKIPLDSPSAWVQRELLVGQCVECDDEKQKCNFGRQWASASVFGSELHVFGGLWQGGVWQDVMIISLESTEVIFRENYLLKTTTFPLSVPPPKYGAVSIAVHNHLFIIGGAAPPNIVGSDTWTWDAELRLWADTSIVHVPIHRSDTSMVRLDDDSFVIFGGSTMFMEETLLNDIWRFDIASSSWTRLFQESSSNDAPAPRANALAAVHEDCLVVMGGRTYVTQVDNKIWKFDITSSKWSIIPFESSLSGNQRPFYREGSLFAHIGNTHIIWGGQLLPGVRGYERYSSIFSADVSKQSITDQPPQSQDPIRRKFAYYVAKDKSTLLLYGGQTFEGSTLDDLWTLDTRTWVWTHREPKNSVHSPPKISHGASNTFRNSTILFGGRDESSHPIPGAWYIENETYQMVPLLVQNLGGSYQVPSQQSSIDFGESILFFGGKHRNSLTNQVAGYTPGFCSYDSPQVIQSVAQVSQFEDGSKDARYLQGRDCMWLAPSATHILLSFQLGQGDVIRISEYLPTATKRNTRRVIYQSLSVTEKNIPLSGSLGYTIELITSSPLKEEIGYCGDCHGFQILHAACPALARLDPDYGCQCPAGYYMDAQNECRICDGTVLNPSCPASLSSEKGEDSFPTIVAVSVSVSMLAVVFASFYYARLHKKAMMQVRGMENKLYMHIPFKDMEFKELLGSGRFGEVYHGVWRGADVAIKRLRHDGIDSEMIAAFTSEISMMVELRHPNIVLYMGACAEVPNLCIVCELLTGTLYQLLHRKEIEISLSDSLGFLCDIAKGMQYLHASTPAILHRDLKSLNLLLDDRGHVKVSDFGMTAIQGYETKDRSNGSLQWMAPEIISGEEFTAAADVYSFGIVMWEVLSRRDPYEEQETVLSIAVSVVFENLRPTIDFPIDLTLRSIMVQCWDPNPGVRPIFSNLIREIKEVSALIPPSEKSKKQGYNQLEAESPNHGEVCVVAGLVTNCVNLFETYPDEAEKALYQHHDIVRDESARFMSRMLEIESDCFIAVFNRSLDALRFATSIQVRLHEATWPTSFHNHPSFIPNQLHNIRGLRVQMGIHFGSAQVKVGDGAIQSLGKVSDDTTSLCMLAQGGQILMSQYAHEVIYSSSQSNENASFVMEMAPMNAESNSQFGQIYQVAHNSLKSRLSMAVFSDGTMGIHPGDAFHKDENDLDQRLDFGSKNSSLNTHPFSLHETSRETLKQNLPKKVGDGPASRYQEPFISNPQQSSNRFLHRLRPMKPWEIRYMDLIVEEIALGHGAFGTVKRGSYQGRAVAVKKMLRQTTNDKFFLAFQTEATLLRRLSHPNIVPFVGACLHPPHLAIVTELITPGSLKDVLQDASISISKDIKYKVAKGIIRAMHYLHSQIPPVLHRDLKTSNVLVDKDFNPYLCDFGFARVKLHNQTMTKCGSAIYQAPEVISGKRYDEKADVYSFGVVLWEIHTRKNPYRDLSSIDVAFAVVHGTRPPITSRTDPTMIEYITKCWSHHPQDRPTFAELNSLFLGT
eukprot:TRINITY_DN5290_c0_g1_i4.p1 TRINITY_DN5290_c0_g1~~TRINITY_DN5290_c0_g1_i4.p1  ORF type:complete len:2519 (-),score=450.95 TRINITY_DN5290_c0_g1_i4:111-7667(-)